MLAVRHWSQFERFINNITTYSCILEFFLIFASKLTTMTFDKILDDNRLWAVRYDGESDNALQIVFNQWNNPE